MKNSNQADNVYSLKFILWVIFYCYSTFSALIFQQLLLPLFPAFHGGSGLIGGGDSVYFNDMALRLADSIRSYGWNEWTIWPTSGVTGNVSILAALYVIFGNDPGVIIPVNAAIHATSGLFVYLLARLLWPGRVGTYSGILAATLFVIFPSALNWYAQNNRDGFAILGMLIIFYSWLHGMKHENVFKSSIWIAAGTISGLVIFVFVTPYNVKLQIISACIFVIITSFSRSLKHRLRLCVCFIVSVMLLMLVNHYIPQSARVEYNPGLIEGSNWKWEKCDVLPDKVDNTFENMAKIRLNNILYSKKVEARSLVDENVRPNSVISVLAYIPRALQIAILAPFPNKWLGSKSIVHIVSTGETFIWYFFIPGLFLAFYYNRRFVLLYLMALNAIVFLAIYGFSFPNIGTLYRIRYLYLFILMLIGVMGWMELARRKYGEKINNISFRTDMEETIGGPIETTHEAILPQTRSIIATAGFTVITFTFLSNVLFVARDIILARWFGLGNELDAFFIAMIVPMFLVTVMSVPVGTIMVPPLLGFFKSRSHEKAQQLITVCSTMIFCSMVVICLLLLFFSHYYIPVLGWGFTEEKMAQSQNMLIIVLPLLFFSGFVILGNSILNARQKFALPALVQAIVPIIAIVTLLIVARQIGIYAMAIGMCIGQIANLLIVGYFVHKEGFTILPEVLPSRIRNMINNSSEQLKNFVSQYTPLVFSSIFVSLVLPVNNVIAASLSAGSVSAFNLGMKFIVFFTGLIGTGIATVMLPYFSSYFARNRIIDVRRELSFFLFIVTVIPIPLTVIMYFLTGPMVRLIFGGGAFTLENIDTVKRVIEYGIIQLPFFCMNMLFVKYANAKQKNALIMISSFLGLTLNVILNFVFIGRMGVGGIALASSLSVMFSTILLIVVGHRYNDVSWVDVIFTTLTWLLFLTILLCYHFRSMSGVIIASTSLTLTVVYHLVELFEHKPSTERRAP
jgi:putative peptidoglycan lipid II flippase